MNNGTGNRYEVFTTGVDDLWYNTYNADKEYLRFIVRVLLGVQNVFSYRVDKWRSIYSEL